MLKFYFNKRIIAGVVAALLILFSLAYLSLENKSRLVANSDSVAHTLDVLLQSERVLSLATNMELGQRGFAITGNDTFLLTFNRAKNAITEEVKALTDITADNSKQQAKVTQLNSLVLRLATFCETAVRTRERGFDEAIKLNSTLQGKFLLDSVRQAVAQFQEEEHRLLAVRSARNDHGIMSFNRTFIYLLVAITLILLVTFYAINVNLKARIESEMQLNLALNEIEDLYNNAPCGYHSLDHRGVVVNVNNTLCNWLGYKREEIVGRVRFPELLAEESHPVFEEEFAKFKDTGMVRDLEMTLVGKNGALLPISLSAIAIKDEQGRYIKSRTITIDNTDRKKAEMEIKNLNRELEAFTYSVSHDLRAPLRSVDGYARILQEDYGTKLDAEGERVINVIVNNARRMGKLIDDLLEFARLGRKELQRTNVDMTSLVNSVKKELLDDHRGRSIEIRISQLDSAPVDIDMIKQVWVNLLSNAIKYTGKTENPRIEVFSIASEDEIEYVVSDNGVGFDMQYVSKLFGVFQRLHRIQDFSGTGVGLAIVKRVVEKHHGRVWANAVLNEGATFHFSIPTNNGKH
ncbi:MAG TPA: CHASE3 domain-containing protein [Chryseosolibacter sp.]